MSEQAVNTAPGLEEAWRLPVLAVTAESAWKPAEARHVAWQQRSDIPMRRPYRKARFRLSRNLVSVCATQAPAHLHTPASCIQ